MNYLTRPDWAPDVKKAINDFLEHSVRTDAPDSRYAVFDFDNTAVVFDGEDLVAIYQLQQMAFAIRPNEMAEVLRTDLGDCDRELKLPKTGHLQFKGKCRQSHTYNDWIEDISAAYARLYEKYQFTAGGMVCGMSEPLYSDPDWREFATKLRGMFDVVLANETKEIAFLWMLYWFTGMTDAEVYDLAYRCFETYSKVETSDVTWVSPDIESRVGAVTYTWRSGISMTENIAELMQVLCNDGIDVWMCSASSTPVVCAGIDCFGMHSYVKGVLGVVNKKNGGRIMPEYDPEGCAALSMEPTDNICLKDAAGYEKLWRDADTSMNADTEGIGKVTAISNVLCSVYGHGPNFCAMDSTGDFNFCTEYESTELVLCMNTQRYGPTNGGALIGEVAIYQRDVLGYDFETARASGDTFYVLQGRDERGMRKLIGSNATVRFEGSEAKLFSCEANFKQLEFFSSAGCLSTAEILNRFCIHTAADDPENPIHSEYGFLTEYAGYHKR